MEKNWNAMEKLWKSYGIFFLGICTNPVTGELSEEDATYRLFQDILKKDPGAVIEDVCDVASIIFVQTSQRKEILCRYPSVIFLDTSLRGEHKMSVIVVDGDDSAQVCCIWSYDQRMC